MIIEAYVRQRRQSLLLVTASCLTGWASLAPFTGANAQATTAAQPTDPTVSVGEVVVTASRRSEAISKLPFNISAYGAKQLERANISSITQLTQEVPNFVIQDQGARASSSSIPIIRGLNASQPVVASDRYFQSPVGFYLGNAPITGTLPLEDVQRIEVLRGPQGTLYGSGSLSGAVRILPNDPQLGHYSGSLTGSVEGVAHSSHLDYDVSGFINIPIGEDLALRVVGKEEYDAGFIQQNDILRRTANNFLSGTPILANPSDVANSSAEYFNAKDVNWARTTSVRASLLWQPNDRFILKASGSYAYVDGNGGPLDNYTYGGGPSPIDPRITLAPTGDYQRSSPTLEPFSRHTELFDIDASYDLGFATLASTFAYGRTRGTAEQDVTATLLGTPVSVYYTGAPANPRLVLPVSTPDDDESYTEELRLVSKDTKTIDYVVGAFFQQETHFIGENVWNPGTDVQSAAAHGGSTVPIVLGGTYVPLFANGATYLQSAFQYFHDYSLYGDLTWHITDRWQITGGARVFYQTFSQNLSQASSLFLYTLRAAEATSLTSQVFKANTSYKLDEHTQFYATWSQGFRRGGANAFPTMGAVEESPSLLLYKPDTTNNYELGLKGTRWGLIFSIDGFYVDWSNPQIDLLTPYNLYSVVVNAKAATSEGFEFDASGPIGPEGLTFDLGLAYARARLSEDFSLPAGSGVGTIIPDAITGKSGARLPGAPDFSGSANVNYKHNFSSTTSLTYSLGVDYRGSTVNILPGISSNTPASTVPGYALIHGSITLEDRDWEFSLFGTNLTDSHIVLSTTVRTLASLQSLGSWGDSYAVGRPREVGIRLTRRW